MTTLRSQQPYILVFVTIAGLLAGLTGCSADVSGSPRTPPRSSSLAPQDPPPPPPSTQEECAACHGLWGVHGIEPIETCICKTHDEGHDCTDGADCEGECLLADDAQFHVMDQGDPPRGYYVGHCASHQTTFGCFRHVPPGIETELPLTPEEAGPYVCVD
jgi:hypothetical protein